MRVLKVLPLLVIGMLASLALIGPATASATEWKYEGEPIAEEQIEFEGYFNFEILGSGVSCLVDGEATIANTGEPGGGEITSFDFGPGCTGFGTLYEGCEVESAEAALPMSLHLDGTEVKIEGFAAQIDFAGGWCVDMDLTADEDITATPDNPDLISSLDLAGPVTQTIPGVGEFSNWLTGSLDITPAEKYEIA